jgi:hypothetical protein
VAVEHLTATPALPSEDRCRGEIQEVIDPVTIPNSTFGSADLNSQTGLDSVAEALLQRAIQHQALTPDEARDLATWDLTTITEYLALRLQKEGLLTARECRAMLGTASPGH